ncbi:hypothetical protein NXW64_02475 [Bacteroides ovatus]|nr:hypothetical protein NXW64_02475 [Bacteroides ovatus]
MGREGLKSFYQQLSGNYFWVHGEPSPCQAIQRQLPVRRYLSFGGCLLPEESPKRKRGI